MLAFLRRILGLSVLVGFGLMRTYYTLGVLIIFSGLAFALWEVCVEPELVKRPFWNQVVGIALILIFGAFFTIGIVGAQAPIVLQSYAMRNGNYSDGEVIEGIKWNSHFTDLRVAVTNPSDIDYQDLDVTVYSGWTHQAVMMTSLSGCSLSSMGGNTIFFARAKESGSLFTTATRTGASVDFHDSQGNVYSVIATQGGYRLRCGQFPNHYTMTLVFALVSVPPKIMGGLANGVPAGKWGLADTILPAEESVFNELGPKPASSIVSVKAHYIKNLKPYSVSINITVEDGNPSLNQQ